MSDAATTLFALQRNWDMVTTAVAGVDDDTLNRMPNPESNSMSWLIWHMTRVADRFIHTRFQGTGQMWTDGGWHQRFGMEKDPDEFGIGWSVQQVADWSPPSRDTLMGYYDAVNAISREYVGSLSAEDMKRQVPAAAPGTTMSLGDALGIMVWDNIVHGGQIAYIRGFIAGSGWHR